MSLWYKGSTDSRGQVIAYYGQGTNQGQNGYIELRQTNVGSQKRLRLRYGSHSNYLQLTTPNGSITPSTWQHIMVTYDGGTTGSASDQMSAYYSRFNMYIDGVLQTTSNTHQNYGYSAAISAGNWRIGRITSGSYMRGTYLDELALWDSDQSSNISTIYNGGNVKNLDSLNIKPKHWWRMGDGDTYPYLQDNGTEGNCIFEMNNMTSADIVNDVP